MMGDGYSLFCNNIATTALKHGYDIIINEYYTIRGSTAQNCSYNRFVPCKSDVKHCSSNTFRTKRFHNDAKNTCGPQGKKMSRRIISLRAANNKCKCSYFCNQYNSFGFQLAPKVGNQFHSNHPKITKEQIIFPPRLFNKEIKAIICKISKAGGNHNTARNVGFHTTGVMHSSNNIHYLSGLCNELENLDGIKAKNSTEKMMDYLKKKKFNRIVLCHYGSHNQLMNVYQDECKK